jgi:hypothetical protein
VYTLRSLLGAARNHPVKLPEPCGTSRDLSGSTQALYSQKMKYIGTRLKFAP